MKISIKSRLVSRLDSEVKRISLAESARIARLNPGPGIPLSMLSVNIQQRLQDGGFVSSTELEEDISEVKLSCDSGHGRMMSVKG